MKKAWLFPGQGAQKIGMGADFYSSDLCTKASEICGFDLVEVMRDGPAEKLQQTTTCQPALFLHSALVLEKMRAQGVESADYYLGLSLGEYTALYAAGVLSFEDAVKALAVRGKAMQEACNEFKGGMVSVLGLDDQMVTDCCEEVRGDGVLQAANFNAPGQVVISGDLPSLERAIPVLKEKGARRVMPLSVAGAFHSPLMSSAAEVLRNCLQSVTFSTGAEKVISNVTAAPVENDKILETLVRQVTAPVLWSSSISMLHRDKSVAAFSEIGTGRVLSGLVKRTVKDVQIESFESVQDLGDS